MSEMKEFSLWLLSALADFLAKPPVFYLFGLICFIFILKAVLIIIKPHV